MADELFDRRVRVVVGTKEFTNLRCDFTVTKTLKPQPNRAEVSIYNLNKSSRKYLEEAKVLPVQIDAGYVDAMSTIFLGNLRTGYTAGEDKATQVTHLWCGDGEAQLQKARIAKAFPVGVTPDKVLREVASALGVSQGNLNQAITQLRIQGLGKAFADGCVLYGWAPDEMTRVCSSLGLSWSVQSGKLQVLPLGKALDGTAIVLSPETGLIGSPIIDNKGKMSCTTLMIRDMFPGRKVLLRGRNVQGQYIVEQTVHRGSSYVDTGIAWGIDVDGKRY